MNASQSRSPRATGWVGWIAFAAVMMMVAGFFNIIDGLAAVFSDDVFVRGSAGIVVLDLTAWGWWHAFWGLVLLAAGLALFQGAFWARLTAIAVVVVNAITQAIFLPAYPVWSVLIITVDALVLWALMVHGDEQVLR
jgi:hypothetical protein